MGTPRHVRRPKEAKTTMKKFDPKTAYPPPARPLCTPARSPKFARRHPPVEPLEPLEETSPINQPGLQNSSLPGFGTPSLPAYGTPNLPGLPIPTHDPLDYSTPRGGGLPSLLTFSTSNTNSPVHMRSPPRRLLPEPEPELSQQAGTLSSQPWHNLDS